MGDVCQEGLGEVERACVPQVSGDIPARATGLSDPQVSPGAVEMNRAERARPGVRHLLELLQHPHTTSPVRNGSMHIRGSRPTGQTLFHCFCGALSKRYFALLFDSSIAQTWNLASGDIWLMTLVCSHVNMARMPHMRAFHCHLLFVVGRFVCLRRPRSLALRGSGLERRLPQQTQSYRGLLQQLQILNGQQGFQTASTTTHNLSLR